MVRKYIVKSPPFLYKVIAQEILESTDLVKADDTPLVKRDK